MKYYVACGEPSLTQPKCQFVGVRQQKGSFGQLEARNLDLLQALPRHEERSLQAQRLQNASFQIWRLSASLANIRPSFALCNSIPSQQQEQPLEGRRDRADASSGKRHQGLNNQVLPEAVLLLRPEQGLQEIPVLLPFCFSSSFSNQRSQKPCALPAKLWQTVQDPRGRNAHEVAGCDDGVGQRRLTTDSL